MFAPITDSLGNDIHSVSDDYHADDICGSCGSKWLYHFGYDCPSHRGIAGSVWTLGKMHDAANDIPLAVVVPKRNLNDTTPIVNDIICYRCKRDCAKKENNCWWCGTKLI